jgi:hypothetical protein
LRRLGISAASTARTVLHRAGLLSSRYSSGTSGQIDGMVKLPLRRSRFNPSNAHLKIPGSSSLRRSVSPLSCCSIGTV